jgi:murein L,D-transpeptidase YafK
MASEAYDKALQLDRANAAAQTKLAMIKDLFSGSVVPGKGSPESAESVATAPPASTTTSPAITAKPATPPAKGDADAVLSAVNGWARAWSHKNADAYLGYYAPTFQVPGGEARSSWEATRRERIIKPKLIEVTVASPRVSFDADGRAVVKFRQGYKSDTLNTSGAKTLVLVKNNERWQIVQERMN